MLIAALVCSTIAVVLSMLAAALMLRFVLSYERDVAPLLQIAREALNQRAADRGERYNGIPPAPTREWPSRSDPAYPGALAEWFKAYQRTSNEPTEARIGAQVSWDVDERIEEEEHRPAPGSKAAQPPPE